MRNTRVSLLSTLILVLLSGACFGQAATAPAAASAPATSQPASVLRPGDRILFIGDSITGLGDRDTPNVPKGGGFVQLIRAALKEAHPNDKYELVTLGSSGSTVGAWNIFFARAADPKHKEFGTDVHGNGVKATLAKNWDVVIIMLGMNDALQPTVVDEKVSLERWTASYAKLIQTVRDRLHPRVVALAQCTMATEDPNSAMNKFIDKLNMHVAALARKENCTFLTTNQKYKDIFIVGRNAKADFHIMYDHVHPNAEGQMAIAMRMLGGLGEEEAAWRLSTETFLPIRQKFEQVPHIVCRVVPHMDWEGQTQFAVSCRAFAPTNRRLKFHPPDDWSIAEQSAGWRMNGKPDRMRNVLRVESEGTKQSLKTEVVIPAPWLITAGPIHVWREKQLDEKAARTSVDDAIEAGKDFTSKDIEVAWETTSVKDYGVDKKKTGKLTWHRFFPSIDYTGGDAPGNVDFFSISHPRAFETGYAARWVWSEKDRPVRLEASSKGFTKQTYVQVWLNGKKEYAGEVSEEKGMKKEWRTTLKKGWNCTVFRCCHRNYFFQAGLEILPVDKDTLEDLRFSVVPKTAESPAPK